MKKSLLLLGLLGLALASCDALFSSQSTSDGSSDGGLSSAGGASSEEVSSSEEAAPVLMEAVVTFGTVADSTVSTSMSESSYELSGYDLGLSLSAANCYAPATSGTNALRLGSSSKAGTLTVAMSSSYVLESVDVYCYQYGTDDAFLGFKVGGTPLADPTPVNWTDVPTLGVHDGTNCVSFDGVSSFGSVSSFALFNNDGRQRVNVCEIVVSFYLEGAPGASDVPASSSEPSSSAPSSSSSSESPVIAGGDLEEDYEALSSSVRSYYAAADLSKTGSALKSEFTSIIHSHTNVGYNGLWDVYKDSDDDGSGNYWDMYSDIRHRINSDKCGNYGGEGDCINREHVIPQSVFDERSPMVSDAHQVLPTDGYVNGRRSNYPFGEVGSATYTSKNGSKVGTCSYPGYSGTVFEPIDEYKGDFARIHFYFVTCYASEMKSGWGSYASFTYSSALGLSSWAQEMLLTWAAEDPVSEKEIERNDAVYSHQKNRNPFVDFPSLAEAVFG